MMKFMINRKYLYPKNLNFQNILSLAILFILSIRALELRLPNLMEDFHDAELLNNYYILFSTHIRSLLIYIAPTFQTFLDFFIRKIVWITLLGHNEIAFVIPNLFYSLLCIMFGYISSYMLFQKELGNKLLSFIFGFIIAYWVLVNPSQIAIANEARMYSFTALISMIWFYLYFIYHNCLYCHCKFNTLN